MNLNLVKSTVTRKEDEPVRTGDIYIHCYKVLTEAELHTYIYIYIYIHIHILAAYSALQNHAMRVRERRHTFCISNSCAKECCAFMVIFDELFEKVSV